LCRNTLTNKSILLDVYRAIEFHIVIKNDPPAEVTIFTPSVLSFKYKKEADSLCLQT
jgi:hypothetical protein